MHIDLDRQGQYNTGSEARSIGSPRWNKLSLLVQLHTVAELLFPTGN